MSKLFNKIKVLNREEMEQIHSTALRILSEIGMKIDHDEALDHLQQIGCTVKKATKIVKFPDEVVEKIVGKMKIDFAKPERQKLNLPFRFSRFFFSSVTGNPNFSINAGGFSPYINDFNGKRRNANIKDVRDAIRLADQLPNIDFIGLPCSAQEINYKDRPIIMTAELLKGTDKIGGIEVWNKRDIEYIYEMAIVVKGSEEKLKKEPILVGYGEARSPLCIDHNMAEIFMEYVKKGIPQSLDTMPNGGASAPATSAATLAMGIAETLGGLVLGYSINPDAVISVAVNPGLADMQSGIFPYTGADRLPLLIAAVQMINEFYGCPGGIHGGKTDSCEVGVQAGYEKALSMVIPLLAGATGIGTVGHIENGLTYSPVQLVIDDEIGGYIRRIFSGFNVNEETLSFDIIKEVGIGGNFLAHMHTVNNFRKEFWTDHLSERMSWDSWVNSDPRGVKEKAREKALNLIKSERPSPLSKEQMEEIDEIVAFAVNKE